MDLPTINIVTQVTNLTPGSLMVLRVSPSGLDPAKVQMHLVAVRDAVREAQAKGHFPDGKFLVMRDDMALEDVPASVMNSLGWYRQDDTAACLLPTPDP